jgi:outer membrane protein assembly factor BamB
MKLGGSVALVLLFGLLAFISPSSAVGGLDSQEWPTFYGNWARTGHVDATLPDELELLWEFPGEWDVIRSQSSPVIAGGKVYFTAENRLDDGRLYIYALNAENGSLIWSYRTGWSGSPAEDPTPTVVDGKVYVGSWDNYFYCFDAETGELKWKFCTRRPGRASGVDGAPVVVDNVVYFGSWNGYFYALDANTGELIWKYSDGNGKMGHAYGAPTFVDGVVYFATGAGSGVIKRDNFNYTGWVYALDAKDGSLIWDFPVGDEAEHSIAVVDNRLYVGFGFMGHLPGDGMWALDARTGELLWYFDTKNMPVGSPAVAHGKVYFGCKDGYVYALSAENGQVIWKYHIGGPIFSSPIVVGDKVLIGNDRVHVLDAETGELLAEYGVGHVPNSPAFAYGKLYFIDFQGGIKAYAPPAPELPKPAPLLPTALALTFIVAAVAVAVIVKMRRK